MKVDYKLSRYAGLCGPYAGEVGEYAGLRVNLRRHAQQRKHVLTEKGETLVNGENQTLVDELWIIVEFSPSCRIIERNP